MKTLKRLAAYYKPYLNIFIFDMICAIAISVIDLSYPLILNYCTRHLFVSEKSLIIKLLPIILVVLLIMYIIRMLCRYYVSAQGHIMGAMMERDMRADLFDQYQRLSFSYYDTHNTGVMMSRVISDLFDISEFAHHGPENLFISLIKIIGSFCILSMIHLPLALILLFVTVIMALFSFSQNKRMRRTFDDNRRRIGDVNATVLDSLSGIRIVQSFTNESYEKEKFKHSNDAFLDSKRDNYHAMGFFQAGNGFFLGLLYVTLIGAGGYFVINNTIDPISLATFALYINIFVAPIEVLVEFTEMLQKGLSGFRRFEEIIDEQPDVVESPDAKPLTDVKGHICFHKVSFTYDHASKVLDQVDIDIPAGDKIAVVGPSGSGKTTLCSLIPRFYDVTQGAITIDGHDVRDVTLNSLRQTIGLVSQDVYLFNASIYDNIAYGNLNASEEEIIEAAKKAYIHDDIMSFPDGYQTLCGERGTRLSGGQKQRIAIARVFLKNPSILILDEATSALDNESERIVQKGLEDLSVGRTCVMIAHRLSTIKNADHIIVIDNEGIKQQGTHDELMAKGGLYKDYYNLQFRQ